jgi:hypothetical protein
MLYREIIAVYSQIYTKHINTLCGQNVEMLNVKLVVHIVTTELWRATGCFRLATHLLSLVSRWRSQLKAKTCSNNALHHLYCRVLNGLYWHMDKTAGKKHLWRSRDSSIGRQTTIRAGRPRNCPSISGTNKRRSCNAVFSRQALWGPPGHVMNGYWGILPGGTGVGGWT